MRLALMLLAPLGVTLVLSAPSGAATGKPCANAKSTTLARNAQVRVYRLGANRVFACHFKKDRARFLGYSGHDDASDVRSVLKLRLAGRYVAFGDGFGCDRHYGDCGGSVKVIDVPAGKRAHALYVQDTRLAGEPPSQVPQLWDLALRRNGAAALIIGPTETGDLEVWKLESHGNARLDNGPDIDPGSLAISERLVYWRRGGQAFSAEFR